MKRLFFVSACLTAAAFAQDPCEALNAFLTQRDNCVAEFRSATAPSKQPEEGVFTADTSYKKCFDNLKRQTIPKNVQKQCRMDAEIGFEKALKACVLRQWNKANCEAELAKAAGGVPDALRDSAGSTLLLRAAENLNRLAFDFFLSKGADIHATDASGKNVLMKALSERFPGDPSDASLQEYYKERRENQLALVNRILKEGVSPNELDLAGLNALDYAMFVPGIDGVVDALLAAGVRPGVIVSKTLATDSEMVTLQSSNFLRTIVSANLADVISPYTEKIWNATKNWEAQLLVGGLGLGESLFWSAAEKFVTNGTLSEETVAKAFSRGISANGVGISGTSFYLDFLMDKELVKFEKIAKAFWKSGVNLDGLMLNREKISLLKLAIETDNLKLLVQILSKKPDLKKEVGTINFGEFEIPVNALEVAALLGKMEAVKRLIAAKADVKGSLALGMAVLNDDVEMAKVLIAAKANVNDMLLDGSALIESSKSDKMTALLKKNGAVIPFRGSFIDYCRNSGLSLKDVSAAFDGGADVNEVDSDGLTPLHVVSALSKDPKVVEALLKRGAVVNSVTNSGWTPFIYAAKQNGNPEILKVLVRYGADVSLSPQNSGNWDALFYAVANNPNPAVTAKLLSMGLDEDYSDRDKHTLIIVAIKNNPNEKVLIQLFKRGYKVNPENSWWDNPLTEAVKNSADLKIVKVLLQAHAKVTDEAVRAAQNLSAGKYRNQVLDMLLKAKKAQK